MIEAVSAGPHVEPLAAAVARLITDATGTDVCFVHVLDDSGRRLVLSGATPPFDAAVGTVRLPLGEGVTGWVASHRRPAVLTADKHRDPRYVPIPALRGTDFVSMASVPMASETAGLVGVLNVHTVTRREFTADDVRLLTGIGSLVAGALHAARLHRQLLVREQDHERFTEQAIVAQETERGRLARDIHDGIMQRLVSQTYHLDAARRAMLRAGCTDGAEQVRLARELTGLCLQEARAAIGGLRPPVLDDLGLAGGLASLARTTPGVTVDLTASPERLSESQEIALYRIAQEALQNVVKHAAATRTRITFTVEDTLVRLEVTDNGRGLPDDGADGPHDGSDRTRGYGMQSMAERADLIGGTFTVRSRPGAGTVVTVTTPR